MYIVAFQIEISDHENKQILEDYSWWPELVKKIASKADKFEIRCWPDEPEAIATGQRFGRQIENKRTTEAVFKGPITEAFLQHICRDYLDEAGALKWFTLNLYRGEEGLFHSGHYGSEPVVYVKTKEEMLQLKEWSKQYPAIWRVDVHKHPQKEAGL